MATVLIVDDEVELAELIGMRLESAGWSVDYAATGAQALRYLVSHTPVAAVLDVVMPEMNGWALGAAIRANHATAQLPLIYMTARQAQDVAERAAMLHAPVLLKPFAVDALLALLPK